jgi:hypothetical protein
MSIRQAARRVAVTVATVSAAGALSLAIALPAGAAVTTGSSGPYAVAVAPFTTGAPFSSGQTINVVVPTNTIFPSTSGINIVECAAPGGVDPTLPGQCDGNSIQSYTVMPNSDGSINLESEYSQGYPIYALPDSISLGEGASNAVTCGDTAATECVLYIGNDQTNFSAPHVFSQPFNVLANADDLGENPGDGSQGPPPQTPEVPYAVILPVAAMGILGGTVLVRRRRALSKSASSL